jgi:hypothetical protein
MIEDGCLLGCCAISEVLANAIIRMIIAQNHGATT